MAAPLPGWRFRREEDSAVAAALQGILSLVLSGSVRAGERLPTEILASRLGMSRTPIREALRQLSSDGMVELVPRGGARLVRPTPEEVLETYELRAHLEVLAVRKVVRRLTPLGEARLEACLAGEGVALISEDPWLLFSETLSLHRVLVDLAESPVLADTLEAFFRRTYLYALLMPLPEAENRVSAKEHRDIVDALKARDGIRAERLIQAHVLLQGSEDAALLRQEIPQERRKSWKERNS